jgi:hypothetical protein
MSLIDRRVTQMGYIWHPRRVDHGIDGEIELIDRSHERPLNRTISVQSKARQRFSGEDTSTFHYVCDRDDVDYWMEANAPVILVCSHPDSDEAWWAPVSEIFKDPARRQSRKVIFDKSRDRFDVEAAAALLDLAVPPSGGLHVVSARKPERLTSNLLQIEALPETIWATPTTVPGNREAGEVLRRNGVFAVDWTVLDRTIFSFRRTDEEPFTSIVDGRAEAIQTSEWSETKSSDTHRDFVRLLNQTLAESLHEQLRRHHKRHYLYFRPTKDLSPRILSTGKSKRGRTVFQGYPDRRDPDAVKYFRHHALDHQFVRFDKAWYLELNPTYHFTSDGYRDLPWGSELVKEMKRREKNSAVRQLVGMWANYLVGTDNFFSSRDDLPIRFGRLETFMVDRGVDDLAWKRSANAVLRESCVSPSLFEAS